MRKYDYRTFLFSIFLTIIFITDNISPFLDITLPFFQAATDGQFRGVTGEMTLAALLTKPYALDDDAAVTSIHAFFDDSHFIRLLAHDKNDFVLSAQLRGTNKLKAIDRYTSPPRLTINAPFSSLPIKLSPSGRRALKW